VRLDLHTDTHTVSGGTAIAAEHSSGDGTELGLLHSAVAIVSRPTASSQSAFER